MARPMSVLDRKMLLATVSAAALVLSWGPQARAADIGYPAPETVEPGRFDAAADIWVAAEGRYNMFTDSSIFGENFVYGPNLFADPDDGWSGGLELGVRPAGSQFDYVLRLIYGKAEGDDGYSGRTPYFSGNFDNTASVEEEHIVADFEVGRHLGIGMGDTRIHAGVRFVHFEGVLTGADWDTFYGTEDFLGAQRITALGPRIGLDQRIPLTGNLYVDLSAAGSVLFGRREVDFVEDVSNGIASRGSDSVTVWNAEASGGLTYMFGPVAATLGYRIDAFWDLYGSDTGFSGGDDRITHGPFAKLKVYMSGGDRGSDYASDGAAGGFADTFVWVSLEGRYNMFTDSPIFGEIYTEGPNINADPDDGWSGGLELGARAAGSPWDYVARVIYGRAEGDDAYTYYYPIHASVEEDHVIADFEVGRHLGIGIGDTRIHAGLRFVHFKGVMSGDDYETGYSTTDPMLGIQKITAIGPRIGVDQKIPLTGALSVDLSAAGAVLFGLRDIEFVETYGGDFSGSDDVTVWNAEASAGLTYSFGPASATVGYRIDAFWDLYGDTGGTGFAGGSDRITHGPFAKLNIYLSGGNH